MLIDGVHQLIHGGEDNPLSRILNEYTEVVPGLSCRHDVLFIVVHEDGALFGGSTVAVNGVHVLDFVLSYTGRVASTIEAISLHKVVTRIEIGE